MYKLTLWSIFAVLLLAFAGCSKDEPTPVGPVTNDQQMQKKSETPAVSEWGELEWLDLSSIKPYEKSYPAAAKKGSLKKTTAGPPIVTNGGFEGGWAGWTTSVPFGPGIIDYRAPEPPFPTHPEWAWIVGASDPFGTNTTIYRTGMLHPEPLPHSGTNGASAVENFSTEHRLFQTDTLPASGNLTLEFWIRWKNQYPAWSSPGQDIIVTFRNPVTDAVLGTLFQASALGLPRFSGGGDITTANYEKRTADVTAFAGQTVKLDFAINGRNGLIFVDLDDIAIVQVVTNHPPVANAGSDQTINCAGPTGVAVNLDGTGSSDPDAGDVLTYTWIGPFGTASGATPTVTLGSGVHTITLTVDDAKRGTATDEVVVTVNQDVTAPTVTLNGPSLITLECSEPYNEQGATVTDDCDLALSASITGSVDVHKVGKYTLTYTATDAAGNTSAPVTRTVNVVDTTPPTITLNGANPMTLECPTPYVELGAVASDACDPSPSLVITGSVDAHALGSYIIRYTATDASGNTATATRIVDVVDTTPPTIVLIGENPMKLEVPATYNELGATVTDACDPSPTLAPPEGTVDGNTVGTYTVIYTASDHAGNTSTATRSVIVEDTQAPILSCYVSISSLWPPTHNLVNVGFKVYVSDVGDADPTISVKVYSDEEEDVDTGDGNYSPDAKDIAVNALRLRAERNGDRDGRVYLIVVTATDGSGNSSFHCCTVVVPHSQSKAAVNAVNAQAAAVRASCGPNGSPLTPFIVGDGPVIGPKQ